MARARQSCMSFRRAWAASLPAALGGLASLTLLAGPAHAATPPSIRVVPTPVPTGSTVTFFGHGFCGTAGCPPVQIDADGRHLVSTTARPDGSFSVRAPINLAPDQYQVHASQLSPSGTLTATTGMTVLPPETGSNGPAPTATTDRRAPVRATTTPPVASGEPTPPPVTGAGSPTTPASAAPTTSAPDATPAASPSTRSLGGPTRPARAPAVVLGLLAGALAACIPLGLLLRLALRRGRV